MSAMNELKILSRGNSHGSSISSASSTLRWPAQRFFPPHDNKRLIFVENVRVQILLHQMDLIFNQQVNLALAQQAKFDATLLVENMFTITRG